MALAVVLGIACESTPVPAEREVPTEPAPASVPLPLGVFSARRAFADVEALAQRASDAGQDPAGALRSYVALQLEATGLALESVDLPRLRADGEGGGAAPGTWTHLVATAAGASPDLFLLVARLDRAGPGRSSSEQLQEDASGAALLLELARVLSTRSLPYTARFVWLAGEDAPGDGPDTGGAGHPGGSEALVAEMAARGDLARIRLLVAFDRVCRDDLRIARDLGSHRVYREEFFDAATRIGRDGVFLRTQDYESVVASHLAFRDAGVRSVVALVAAGSNAIPPHEHPCAAQSLEAVGVVALDALDAIGRRLAKIDRFSRAPLATAGGERATPSPGEAKP